MFSTRAGIFIISPVSVPVRVKKDRTGGVFLKKIEGGSLESLL
jgi:hypothetical protein